MRMSRISVILLSVVMMCAAAPSAFALTYEQAKAVANNLGLDLLPDANLDGWIPEVRGTASVSTSGTTATFGSAGDAAGYLESPAAQVVGLLATFGVTQIAGVEVAGVQVDGWIGFRPNGNEVKVLLWANEVGGGNHHIRYEVDEYDVGGNFVRVIAYGQIDGANSWSPDQLLALGFAVVGDEVWFYSDAQPVMAKVKIFGGVVGYADGMQPRALAYTYSDGDSISAQLSRAWLITRP